MKKIIIALMLAAILLITCACGTNNSNESETPAVPDFETHNVNVNLKTGTAADYKTVCKIDPEQTTVGTVTITEVKHYKNGEALPSESLESLEGYEWVEVKATSVFGDDNAREFGIDRASCVSNYYDLQYFGSHLEEQESGFTKFAVKSGKTEYDQCLYIKLVDNLSWNDDRQSVCNYTWYFRVPEAYDGMVIAFYNAGIEWEDGKYIYEILDADSLVYRVAE